jgi:hypothetical protein
MQDGTITTDLRDTDVFKSTKGILEDIDLYIWLQIGGGMKFFQASYFSNHETIHAKAIDDLVTSLKSTPVSSMDNHGTLQAIIGRQ